MKCLRDSVLSPLGVVLLGLYTPLHAQVSSVSPAPTPVFQEPAVVLPSVGQQPGAIGATQAGENNVQGRQGTIGGVSPFAPTEDDYVPNQAPVTPRMSTNTVDSSNLYTIHLRPLFSTGIKLPEDVVAIDVGASTLIWAEHDKNVPAADFHKADDGCTSQQRCHCGS